MTVSTSQRGFTLTEMLVALAIFALVAAAGVGLLRASLFAQASVAQRLGESGGINRLRALLASELATAQPRPGRDSDGASRAAFTGDGAGIGFTHAEAGEPGAGRLHRVRYALENGALVRRGSDRLDGADQGIAATLLRDVQAVHWRYRAEDGGWSQGWAADDSRRLPRAVELTVERRGSAPLALRFLVGPDGVPPPGQLPAGPQPGPTP